VLLNVARLDGMRLLVAVATRPIGRILGGVPPDRINPAAHMVKECLKSLWLWPRLTTATTRGYIHGHDQGVYQRLYRLDRETARVEGPYQRFYFEGGGEGGTGIFGFYRILLRL
jgi:hypothetical protein